MIEKYFQKIVVGAYRRKAKTAKCTGRAPEFSSRVSEAFWEGGWLAEAREGSTSSRGDGGGGSNSSSSAEPER